VSGLSSRRCAMSGADPRLQVKSDTEVKNQLERRRLAAEREDDKQQELEQLLLMACNAGEVLSETVDYDASRDMFVHRPVAAPEEAIDDTAAESEDGQPKNPASPEHKFEDTKEKVPEVPVVPVKKAIQKRRLGTRIKTESTATAVEIKQEPAASSTAVEIEQEPTATAVEIKQEPAESSTANASESEDSQPEPCASDEPAPRHTIPSDLNKMKGKGKSGVVRFEDGSEWVFGKRGTFQEGHVQHEPEEGTFVRGPDLDPYWRSGTGRWGSRSGAGKVWNKVNWALHSHDVATKGAVSAKGLFREMFPKEGKADFDNTIESDDDIQSWIKHFMDLSQWRSGGKSKGKSMGKYKSYGKGQGQDKGKASSSSAAPSVMPPPPPPR
jgi:hypothetical protein